MTHARRWRSAECRDRYPFWLRAYGIGILQDPIVVLTYTRVTIGASEDHHPIGCRIVESGMTKAFTGTSSGHDLRPVDSRRSDNSVCPPVIAEGKGVGVLSSVNEHAIGGRIVKRGVGIANRWSRDEPLGFRRQTIRVTQQECMIAGLELLRGGAAAAKHIHVALRRIIDGAVKCEIRRRTYQFEFYPGWRTSNSVG